MNALWRLSKMLLKVEKTMSGQKVCKGESMKAPESKGMKRKSYKHLAKLGKFFFFKIFRTTIVELGAFYLPSYSEELRKTCCVQRFSQLRELGCSAAAKLGIDLGSGSWRVLRRLCVRRGYPSTVPLRRADLFASDQSEKRTNC